MLGFKIVPEGTDVFFKNLSYEAIRLREEGKIAQTDMMKLLIDAKKEYEAEQQKAAEDGK